MATIPKKTHRLLTARRKAWAAQRGAATFKGQVLQPPVGVEIQYVERLRKLVRQMTDETHRQVLELFRSEAGSAHFAQDAGSISSQSRILMNALRAKFNDLFARASKPAAERMVDGTQKASASNLHASLKKLSGGMSLQTKVDNANLTNIYKASVAENVSLIKSIPEQYIKQVEGSVMRSITTGNGLQDLVPAIEKYDGVTQRRAANIARDQTRKAYNSINKGRMQAIGVKQFEWIHSGGGAKPRPDHEEMDGQIFSFDDLPVIDPRTGERGIPGQAPNCGCTMRPVFSFESEGADDGVLDVS